MNYILSHIRFIWDFPCWGHVYYNPQRDLWWKLNDLDEPVEEKSVSSLFKKEGFDPYNREDLYRLHSYRLETCLEERGPVPMLDVEAYREDDGFFSEASDRSYDIECFISKKNMTKQPVPFRKYDQFDSYKKRYTRAVVGGIPVSYLCNWYYIVEDRCEIPLNAVAYRTNPSVLFPKGRRVLGTYVTKGKISFLYRDPTTHNIEYREVTIKSDGEYLIRFHIQPYTLMNAKGNQKSDYLKKQRVLRYPNDSFGAVTEPEDILRVRDNIVLAVLRSSV